VILLRCNGPHGEFLNSLAEPHPHFGYHIHKATAESIQAELKPEAGAELTDEFASYPQALRHFLKITNIAWTDSDFPGLSQRNMFNG